MNRSTDGHGACSLVDGDGVKVPQVDFNSMIKCDERSGIAMSAAGSEKRDLMIRGIADLMVKMSASVALIAAVHGLSQDSRKLTII